MPLHPCWLTADWPPTGDRAAFAHRRADVIDALSALRSDPAAADVLAHMRDGDVDRGPLSGFLSAALSHAPYLAMLMVREAGWWPRVLTAPPDTAWADLLDGIREQADTAAGEKALMRVLRTGKRRAALLIALADLAGLWPLERVTHALSALAEIALRAALRHRLAALAGNGRLDPGRFGPGEVGCGVAVLGMGKLGAFELNYSSDIDLIVVYDGAGVPVTDKAEPARIAIGLARDVVRILEERTADGYVFRVDFRLRPDPGATPVAVSLAAAESYYANLAQAWERAAMIKARVVAGDGTVGHRFLSFIKPFVWRRSVDFAAVEDLHAIRRRIAGHHGHDQIALEGHNIKLGAGGIREIEFLTQTQQLVFGGREPDLRGRQTEASLGALADSRRIGTDERDRLIRAYRFLRQVEHRLQMVDDRQTQTLPPDPVGLDAFARFCGFVEPAAFRTTLRDHLTTVDRLYTEMVKPPIVISPAEAGLDVLGPDLDPTTEARLRALGFDRPDFVAETVRGWRSGRYRCTRSERSRRLIAELARPILLALARTPHPARAFIQFDRFLSRLPTGVQLFSMMQATPGLVELLAEMLGTSERLAHHLADNPGQLDSVLSADFFDRLPASGRLERSLADLLSTARDYEDRLDIVRRWTNDYRFRAGVHLLRGLSPVAAIAGTLTDVAEIGLAQLLPAVQAEFARQHGSVPGGRFAVVAMGKLGSREMSIRSDLDLIMVFDVPEGVAGSDGPKPLAPTVYYTRLIQRFLSAVTAPTREGPLYEVDMRLRPSGKSGPLATGLRAFIRYQADQAWTWERMALTRARPIAGTPGLMAELTATFQAILTGPVDRRALLRDAADMRRRIAKTYPGDDLWTVKHIPGGLVDVEFVAQAYQLICGAAHPDTLDPSTTDALRKLGDRGLLPDDAVSALVGAHTACQAVQAYLRLTVDGRFEPATASSALQAGLARALLPDRPASAPDALDRAEARLRALTHRSAVWFSELVGRFAASGDPPATGEG